MKERPILFSAPMVRALLDGTKTQTRRVVKGKALDTIDFMSNSVGEQDGSTADLIQACHEGQLKVWSTGYPADKCSEAIHCPYGQLGDRLFVRETGWERPERTPKMMREGADTWARYYYDADQLSWQDHEDFKAWGFKRRPSIHMPRWASRITLEITGVRVERLQDISEADAVAEGAHSSVNWPGGRFARGNYAHLWWTINGDGSWESNPWVWVVEFKVLKP